MSAIPVPAGLAPASAPANIAVGYAYLNTARAYAGNPTLADQARVIVEYAGAHGLTLQTLVEERSESISTRRQPLLETLLRGESGGAWDVLLVARLDRLARDVNRLNGIVSRLHGGAGRHLISVDEGIDTRQESGRFCARLIEIFSHWDSAAIPDRTRAWVAYKRRRGEPIGHAPYGYTYVNKRLAENPGEQEVIRVIEALRAKPLSYEKIAQYLNARQIPSKRGGGWYPETVKAVYSRLQATSGAASAAIPVRSHTV